MLQASLSRAQPFWADIELGGFQNVRRDCPGAVRIRNPATATSVTSLTISGTRRFSSHLTQQTRDDITSTFRERLLTARCH